MKIENGTAVQEVTTQTKLSHVLSRYSFLHLSMADVDVRKQYYVIQYFWRAVLLEGHSIEALGT